MKATCPSCGREGLVAMFLGVVQTTEVKAVDANGLLAYGETTATGGRLEGVRCPACGEIIHDGDGRPIRSLDALAGWLGRHDQRTAGMGAGRGSG